MDDERGEEGVQQDGEPDDVVDGPFDEAEDEGPSGSVSGRDFLDCGEGRGTYFRGFCREACERG